MTIGGDYWVTGDSRAIMQTDSLAKVRRCTRR